jgi:V8-like Glu-specific endopeptidase
MICGLSGTKYLPVLGENMYLIFDPILGVVKMTGNHLWFSLGAVSSVVMSMASIHGQSTLGGRTTIGGKITISGNSTSSNSWSDTMRKATLAVGQVAKDEFHVDHFQTGGVAILICDKNNHFFIATAKHVFENGETNWRPESLQFRGWRDERNSRYHDFGTQVMLRHNGQPLYTASTTFDLAIIPATNGLLERVKTDPHSAVAIGPVEIADSDETYDGKDVIVLGFPALVGEQYQQRALMRSGIIAWTDSSGPADHEFLIDARIFPGNSGGPVFSTPSGVNRDSTISTGRAVKLLGLVSQTINAKPDAAFGIPLPKDGLVLGAAGIGIIEPAEELIKLMNESQGIKNP